MIITPAMLMQIVPPVMDLVGKFTGKEEEATIFNNILSLSKLGDIFKSPKIGDGLKKIPDWAEGTPKNPGPKAPKGIEIPKGIFGGIPKGDPGGIPKMAPLEPISPLIEDLLKINPL